MLTVDPAAHALSAFRILPGGEGRAYSATWFPEDPWAGLERFVRQGHAVGAIVEHGGGEDYAVLDVLNKDGDIIQDFTIPTAEAFAQIKSRLKLVVECEDGEEREVTPDGRTTERADPMAASRSLGARARMITAVADGRCLFDSDEDLRAFLEATGNPQPDEPLGTCAIHGDYWTDDCIRCGR